MSINCGFTKDNLDQCLKALAKEYRKLSGTAMPAEIILIGGASILVNYDFREMTYDIDAVIQAASTMKEAINHVGDTMGLPNGWLNSDFKRTKSYSPKLAAYSVYYKTFSHILTVRTVSAEYLVAMKLMSGRTYKHDISDIIGILHEQKIMGKELTFKHIDTAVCNLYDDWRALPENAKSLISNILESTNLEKLYELYQIEEKENRALLIDFEKKYLNIANEGNINDILRALKKKL